MNKNIRLEFLTGCCALGFLAWTLRDLLSGSTSMEGNTINVSYTLFHQFAEGLIFGEYPLWDPYSMGGVPFYPQIGYTAFLDPVAPLVILIGKYFSTNTFHLFNIYHLTKCAIAITGTYLLLRKLADSFLLRASLILILTLSSFIITSFQQYGVLYHFVWAPFTIHFLFKILTEKDSPYFNFNGLMFSGFVALQSQAYWFAGIWVTFFFIFLGLLLFERERLKAIFCFKQIISKVALFFLIVIASMAPNFATLIEQSKWIFPGRLDKHVFLSENVTRLNQSIQMSYDRIRDSGDFSNIFNFLRLIFPPHWGVPSEVFTCLGILTWAIGLVGIFFGKHRFKPIGLFLLVSYGLTMLGPGGGIHRLLYLVYPPFWFIRNTSQFAMYFEAVYLFFFILGFQKLSETFAQSAFHPKLSIKMLLGTAVGVAYCSMTLERVTHLRYPQAHYLFLWIGWLAFLVFILWKIYGKSGRTVAFLTIALTHLTVVALCTGRLRPLYFSYVFIFLLFPLVFWWAGQRKWFPPFLKTLFPVGFLFFMVTDLAYHLRTFSNYYGLEAPDARLKFDPQAQPISVSDTRILSPYGDRVFQGEPVSYPSQLYRKAAVFAHNSSNDFKTALESLTPFTHLQLKTYASLLRSGLSEEVLKIVFSVGRPLVELKDFVILTEEGSLKTALKGLSPTRQKTLLERSVFAERSSLPTPMIEKIERMQRENSSMRLSSSLQIMHSSANKLGVRVTSPRGVVLYWSDGYDSWWNASVNGTPVPIIRANDNFKAILLGTGESTIRFSYEPWSYLLSLGIYYGVLLFSFCGALIAFYKKRLSLQPEGFRALRRTFYFAQ